MYTFCVIGAWLIWHTLYRFKVIGRSNLPRGRGYVMVCNHIAAIDPVFVLLARLFGRRMLVLAKEELFEKNFLLTWFFRFMGVVPVNRGKGDSAMLERVVEKVKKGRCVLVFPEGTRSPDGELHRLKSGAFVIAADAGVPIVPCRILYEEGHPRMFRRVSVTIGQPVEVEDLGLVQGYNAAQLRAAKAVVSEDMENLKKEYADTVCPSKE